MAELSTATEIALADISGAEYTTLREDAAPGLLRLSLNRLKTWLLGTSALKIDMTGAVDGQALVFDNATSTFIPGDVAAGGGGTPGFSAVVAITGTTPNLLASQVGQYLRYTDAGAKVLTVQDDATEPMPEDGEWTLRNVGAGDLTITPDGGVTINAPAGGSLVLEQDMTCTLKRVATDEYDLIGQTA